MNLQSATTVNALTQNPAQATAETSVFKIMGLDAEQTPKLNLSYLWALGTVGFWQYDDQGDAEYSDYEIDATFETEVQNGDDRYSFNLHITFAWADEEVNLSLGTNYGDGFNIDETVYITADKPWGTSIEEKIASLQEGDAYRLLTQKHPSSFKKIINSANEAYEHIIVKLATRGTEFVGSHTFKSTNDLNDSEPAIVFGGSVDEVSDLLTQQALQNTLFADKHTLIPAIIKTITDNENGSFDECFCTYFKNALVTLTQSQDKVGTVLRISDAIESSKELSDIAFEAMLDSEMLEGRSTIVAIA